MCVCEREREKERERERERDVCAYVGVSECVPTFHRVYMPTWVMVSVEQSTNNCVLKIALTS